MADALPRTSSIMASAARICQLSGFWSDAGAKVHVKAVSAACLCCWPFAYRQNCCRRSACSLQGKPVSCRYRCTCGLFATTIIDPTACSSCWLTSCMSAVSRQPRPAVGTAGQREQVLKLVGCCHKQIASPASAIRVYDSTPYLAADFRQQRNISERRTMQQQVGGVGLDGECRCREEQTGEQEDSSQTTVRHGA